MKCTHDLPFPQKLADAIKTRTNGQGPPVLPCTAVAWNATGGYVRGRWADGWLHGCMGEVGDCGRRGAAILCMQMHGGLARLFLRW